MTVQGKLTKCVLAMPVLSGAVRFNETLLSHAVDPLRGRGSNRNSNVRLFQICTILSISFYLFIYYIYYIYIYTTPFIGRLSKLLDQAHSSKKTRHQKIISYTGMKLLLQSYFCAEQTSNWRRVLMRNCTDHVLPRALVQVTIEKIMLHRSCIAVILLDLYILTCQLTGVILHMLQFQFTMLNILKREFGRYLQLAMLPLRFLGRVGKTVFPDKHTYTHASGNILLLL